jgi:hypothetical protein
MEADMPGHVKVHARIDGNRDVSGEFELER